MGARSLLYSFLCFEKCGTLRLRLLLTHLGVNFQERWGEVTISQISFWNGIDPHDVDEKPGPRSGPVLSKIPKIR